MVQIFTMCHLKLCWEYDSVLRVVLWNDIMETEISNKLVNSTRFNKKASSSAAWIGEISSIFFTLCPQPYKPKMFKFT